MPEINSDVEKCTKVEEKKSELQEFLFKLREQVDFLAQNKERLQNIRERITGSLPEQSGEVSKKEILSQSNIKGRMEHIIDRISYLNEEYKDITSAFDRFI